MKPQMFIGSSVEGLEIANAIQLNLQHHADSTIWTQGVFGLSEGTLNDLLKQASKSDFAAFVLSADDVTRLRGKEHTTARDNVVLELGLFAGALGAKRVFFVMPDDKDFHLPTDLHGITPAKYKPGSHGGNVSASLGGAASQIISAIHALTNPGAGFTNLNGNWTGEWHCNRASYPPVNTFDATITHIGSTVRASFVSNGEHYSVKGTIHRGNLITGIWGDPEGGAAYFGPFQLIISPNGKRLSGRWSGFTQDNKVDSGEFIWSRP
jgi:hypothetical protein